jgi:chromosome segregation ATPase
LFSLNPDSLKALGDFNTVEKTLKIGETEIEVVEVSFKNVEVAAEVPDFAKMIEGKFQELEGKLDLTSFSNKISALESELNQIRESLSAKNAEQAGNTEAAAVAEEKKDEEVQEALKALQAQLEAVSKSIIVLGSAVAPQNARKEESAKSADVKPSEYDGFFGQFFK